MEFWTNLLTLFARIAISALYLWAGSRKVLNWKATQETMHAKQTPYIPILLPIAVSLQLLGGLSILFGLYTRIGAFALIAFTLPATLQMHDFWNLAGKERIQEKAHFLKDCAIIGGLLLLILHGAGRFSLN